MYQSVILKERKGEYLGKTVQVVPHITDEIQVRFAVTATALEGMSWKTNRVHQPTVHDRMDMIVVQVFVESFSFSVFSTAGPVFSFRREMEALQFPPPDRSVSRRSPRVPSGNVRPSHT